MINQRYIVKVFLCDIGTLMQKNDLIKSDYERMTNSLRDE
jgi:hypothetical protein